MDGPVNQKQQKHLSEICRCGKVKLEAAGQPILTADLIRIVAAEQGIDPALVEKDYYSVSDVRFISTGVGRVRFNPPSRVEWRVKANPPYACFMESGH